MAQEEKDKQTESKASNIPIVGVFATFTSSFWSALVPLLSAQYFIESMNKLAAPAVAAFIRSKSISGFPRYLLTNLYAMAVGTLVSGMTGFYAWRTYRDMKTLFAETVGYELGKPKESIGFWDLRKSKNTIVRKTMNNFLQRNAIRGSVSLTYFLPWGLLSKAERDERNTSGGNVKKLEEVITSDISVKAARGLTAGYLVSDIFLRSQTIFEWTQNFVNKYVNHSGSNVADIINATDISVMLKLNRQNINKNYVHPPLNSGEWQQELTVTGRIADLLNQTYNNIPKAEHANLTLPKLIYLVGNGLIEQHPVNLGFIELANRSHDMKDVNTVAAAIRNGQNPEGVFKEFGIDLGALTGKPAQPTPEQRTPQFAATVRPLGPKVASDYTKEILSGLSTPTIQ